MTNRRTAVASPRRVEDQQRPAPDRRGVLGTLSFAALGLLLASTLALVAQLDTAMSASASSAQDCSAFGVSGCTSQAQAGAAVYASVCVSCHGERFEGQDGPPLAGPGNALADYRTVRRLYDYIVGFMPDDDPGSLSEQQYLDVTAFILQANGLNPNGLTLSANTLDELALTR